jgi:hypothetical protein
LSLSIWILTDFDFISKLNANFFITAKKLLLLRNLYFINEKTSKAWGSAGRFDPIHVSFQPFKFEFELDLARGLVCLRSGCLGLISAMCDDLFSRELQLLRNTFATLRCWCWWFFMFQTSKSAQISHCCRKCTTWLPKNPSDCHNCDHFWLRFVMTNRSQCDWFYKVSKIWF